ncbi:MAG: fibronectin type III domain-containing protein, partial [Planctomycetota bacterium]|nr:fibronectin type III domain-containing protein [Planctomycetota bacterium]
QITGESVDLQRTAPAELSLSTASPGDVTLLSPPDGAVDVSLMPLLEWEAASQGTAYELEVATDPDFTPPPAYSATVTGTSHTLTTKLEGATLHYWRVRAQNACGVGSWSAPFSFTTLNMLAPVSYDMLNGETGTYTYFDDEYDGDGDNGEPLAPLSGGLGDLTNGVIAIENWNSASLPYVGWKSIDPTITFHFDESVDVRRVTLHVDDSNGDGGVYPPEDVTIKMGGTTVVFPVDDPPGGEPFAIVCDELDLSGETLELTIADYQHSSHYMMLSEVEIYGGRGCPADFDGDGVVSTADLLFLLAAWGTPDGDVDGDGDTNTADLLALLAAWGPCS